MIQAWVSEDGDDLTWFVSFFGTLKIDRFI
jgi:hypothetical protein